MQFPELRSFLSESRSRLLAAVDATRPERLGRRPLPGKWSPLEVVEHLALAEEWYVQIVTDLVSDGLSRGLRYQPGGPRSTDALAALAAQMDISRPMQAIELSHPTGQEGLPRLLDRLQRSREALLDLLPALHEVDTDQLRYRHPTLHFELNACQWVHLSGLHDRIHARQIRQAVDS